MNAFKIALLGATLLFMQAARAGQDIKSNVFKGGDTITFVGDSITHMGYYGKFVEQYYATRFPNMRVDFRNKGIGGNQASDLLKRMDRDILDAPSDVFTLMIGMNDVGRKNFTAEERAANKNCDAEIARREKVYSENVAKVAEILAKNSRAMIFFTPSIFDQTATAKADPSVGLNDKLGEYGKIYAEIAKKYPSAKVVDMWGVMTKVNDEYQKTEGKDKSIIGADRVHPFDLGGFVMAAAFISDLGEPAKVAEVSVEEKSFKTFNCDVSDFKRDGDKISFALLERALPMVVSGQAKKAVELTSFDDRFNREILSVADLKAGVYSLKIDGANVGTFSENDFAKGVNLSKLKTPQAKQSLEVGNLCETLRTEEGKLRLIASVEVDSQKEIKEKNDRETLEIIRAKAEVKTVSELFKWRAKRYLTVKPQQTEIAKAIAGIKDQIYAAAQPKPHKYEIEPAKQF